MRQYETVLGMLPDKEVIAMADEKFKMSAEVCSCVDEKTNSLNLEICIPGVRKEDIRLKMRNDLFELFAPREDFDYVSMGGFCCPVKAEKADASYDNGVLKVIVPFAERMEDALQIDIH